ncbi:MAG: C39 family peptidase [Motiliproteus sp.]
MYRLIGFGWVQWPLVLALACIPVASAWAVSSDQAGSTPKVVRSVLEFRLNNVVRQQWELSCAAAALATILRYQHGVPVTERSVALAMINREEYLANPDLVRLRQGFSLLDLKRFVDSRGYEGVGLGQLSLTDLIERAPIIVPVNLQGYPHFVVFRGATQDRVLLADPAFGNVTLSINKFTNGWIDYQDIGRVGFVVTNAGQIAPPGRLSAKALDFTVLR